MTETTPTTKKKRQRRATRVLVQRRIGTEEDGVERWSDGASHGSVAEAEQWVKDCGEHGQRYRVIRAYPSLAVSVEKVEQRTVTVA